MIKHFLDNIIIHQVPLKIGLQEFQAFEYHREEEPKDRTLTIFNSFKRRIAPYAKSSADEFENTVGSSITRSTPPFIAISARFHLSRRAGSPALYKITTHYSNSMTCTSYFLTF